MEIVNNIIETTLNSFDFTYCILVNLITYIVIKAWDDLNGNIVIPIWSKRLVLCLAIIAVSIFYYLTGSDTKLILNSAILAPVSWTWIFKPICKKFKIDYKQIDKQLN